MVVEHIPGSRGKATGFSHPQLQHVDLGSRCCAPPVLGYGSRHTYSQHFKPTLELWQLAAP